MTIDTSMICNNPATTTLVIFELLEFYWIHNDFNINHITGYKSDPGPIMGSLWPEKRLFRILRMLTSWWKLLKAGTTKPWSRHFIKNIKIDYILNIKYIGRANFPTLLLPLDCRYGNIWAVLKDLVVLVDVEGDKTSFVVNCADLNWQWLPATFS